MNPKQWALFFVVMLSANYASATFFPPRWNNCHNRLNIFLRRNLNGVKSTFRSRNDGEWVTLGNRVGTRDGGRYTLRNIRVKGLDSFTLGNTCKYNYADGQAVIRFAISFGDLLASFLLVIPSAVGGFLGEFVGTILGIIGHFANKIFHIFFPSIQCNIGVIGDYDSGFRLSNFEILKPGGDLGFGGALAEHGNTLSSYSSLFFAPLEYVIRLFLNQHFKPILDSGIGNWRYEESLFSESDEDESDDDLELGFGGKTGGSGSVGESDHGGKTRGLGYGRKSGFGEKTGGSRVERKTGQSSHERTGGSGSVGKSGYGEKTGGSEVGGKTGGSGSGEKSEHNVRTGVSEDEESGDKNSKSGGSDYGQSSHERTEGSDSGGKSGYGEKTGGSGVEGNTGGSGSGGKSGRRSYERTGGSESAGKSEHNVRTGISEGEESGDENSKSGGRHCRCYCENSEDEDDN